jgi:Ca2+/Na+ antiporter
LPLPTGETTVTFWQFITDHYFIISAVAAYVFLAAVNNLPEANFTFYPWFRGMLRTLANHVPAKYQNNDFKSSA